MKLAITRIRNEEVIIQSTLDRLSYHFDGVVVLDDCSTDNTVQICREHPLVRHIIEVDHWQSDPSIRKTLETTQRQFLHDKACQLFRPDWVLYFDGDEHFYFDDIDWTSNHTYWFKLFHVYITPEDKDKHFLEREWVGMEYAHIPMLFRPPAYFYNRIPRKLGTVAEGGSVKHFGKGISIEHWEETCNYYANHLEETMADGGSISEKWEKRKGKAIHTKSDFGNDLIRWRDRYRVPIVKEMDCYK